MASANIYALSLRHDRAKEDKGAEKGVPCFVSQLAKVKTNVMCQAKNQHLLFEYEKAADGMFSPTESYRKQGDNTMNTDANVRKRMQLLEDKQVIEAIGRFWATFPAVRQGSQQIDQDEYLDVFIKLYKALVAPSEFSINEARKIVAKDWNKDVGAADIMSKDMFFRALFEVADIWTDGISSSEYTSFLSKLFKRVTMTVYDEEKARWVTIFQELDGIHSLIADTVDGANSPAGGSAVHRSDQVKTGGIGASGPAAKPPRPPLMKRKSLANDMASSLKNPISPEDARSTDSSSFELNVRRQSDLRDAAALSRVDDGFPEQMTRRLDRFDINTSDDPLTTRSDVTYHRSIRRPSLSGGVDEASADGEAESSGNTDNNVDTFTADPFRSSPTKRRTRRASTIDSDLNAGQLRRDSTSKGAAVTSPTRPVLPQLPPQHIHLAMPSIYINPEFSQSQQTTDRAARRRARRSGNIANRLRRITF